MPRTVQIRKGDTRISVINKLIKRAIKDFTEERRVGPTVTRIVDYSSAQGGLGSGTTVPPPNEGTVAVYEYDQYGTERLQQVAGVSGRGGVLAVVDGADRVKLVGDVTCDPVFWMSM